MQIIPFVVAWIIGAAMFTVLVFGICVPRLRRGSIAALCASVVVSAIIAIIVAPPDIEETFILSTVFFGVIAFLTSAVVLVIFVALAGYRRIAKRREIAA
jgi:uncharacterized membrane protein AbrB (regulator of aidB expression)